MEKRPTELFSFESPVGQLVIGAIVAIFLYVLTCGIFDTGVHLFFHEGGGHTVVAWFFGMPAVPSIYLTHVSEQHTVLVLAVWAALVLAAFYFREKKPIALAFGGAALLYPLLAFTKWAEVLMLAGGHGGEIFWGSFFLYRAVRGGIYNEGERPLYASLGWLLAIGNILLFGKLLVSPVFRETYSSIALSEEGNDFCRVADMLHSTLRTVSFPMLLLALAGPTTGILLGFRARRPVA
jgi:hypothetical protein